MYIASFLELRTQIASWLNRTDLTTAQISLFVSAVESDIRNDLQSRASWVRVTGTLSDDGFTAPDGFISVRTLLIGDQFATYVDPETYAAKVAGNWTPGGGATYYTINGDDFSVIGGDGSSYEMLYESEITNLSADGDTNWVLENAAELYLWGSLKYGSVFLQNPQAAAGYDTLYQQALQKLNRKEKAAQLGSGMAVRPG